MIIYDNSDGPNDSDLKYESYQLYVEFIKVCYLKGMRLPLKKIVCAHSFDNFSEALTIPVYI